VKPVEFELGRMRYLRKLAEDGDPALDELKNLLPALAVRDRLHIPLRAFESFLWIFVPAFRREKRFEGLADFPSWVERDRTITVEERSRILESSPGFRAPAGTTRIEGLEPSGYGDLRHVPNVTPCEELEKLQAAFDAAMPSDLAALLPEWRRTFPGSYKELTDRYLMSPESDPALPPFGEALRRDADWYFVEAMAEMHRAAKRIRAFRLRAARRKWAVAVSDGLDA